MNYFERTAEFDDWLAGLKGSVRRLRIVRRPDAAAGGNFRDCEPISEGVSEMRIHYGPGYRAYFDGSAALFIYCWPRPPHIKPET